MFDFTADVEWYDVLGCSGMTWCENCRMRDVQDGCGISWRGVMVWYGVLWCDVGQ